MSDDSRTAREEDREERLLDEWRKQRGELDPVPGLTAREEKKFKRMIWRTRFAVMRSVAATLLVLYFVFLIYMMVANITFLKTGKNEAFIRYVHTLVETHETGLFADKTGTPAVELTGLLTQVMTFKVYRPVGEWDVVVGEVTARKPIFGDYSYTLQLNEQYLNERKSYSFALPPDLYPGDPSQQLMTNPLNADWNRFARMEDGYVGEMAFSTVTGMDPEQLFDLLAPYDLRVVAMPVYSGELQTEELSRMSHSSSGQIIYVPALMLRPYVEYMDRTRSWTRLIADKDGLEKSEHQFMKDIPWLIDQGDYNGRSLDKARMAYLNEQGLQVYGAIVTGPIRELEKLKQEKQLHLFELGRIEPWNWRE
ncbi:anti sigma factor C-terminal domain-containing protein [Paenibacillus mendelii]|uniref:Anti sigma factor C-terminal domain-containing protein n=1 Tax=Paenibacillus mendelii TaxID=206163 RepID=A0ABV6J6F3_9BACL|nr:anti sigma factor C-terminal domain-containing protein [Paenibacillus mendelii]MCQ6561969.1 anti-sigma factor C-terminal domain-containing protein [Paenibacillus mendelii]